MAHEHAESGAMVGLMAAVIAHTSLLVGLIAAILTAGAALLPDLDHPSATAARTFGPVTGFIARRLDHFGYWVWECTATKYDRRPRDGHRTITHTSPFAVLAGIVFGAVALGGRWAMMAVLFVLGSLAMRGILARGPRAPRSWLRDLGRDVLISLGWSPHRLHVNAISVTLTGAAFAAVGYALPQMNPILVGACVALGCWVHCLGDSLTLYGCPWLWPIKIRGKRWFLIGTPQAMRFRTGTDVWDGEDRVRVAMHVGIALLLIGLLPGAYGWIGHSAMALVH